MEREYRGTFLAIESSGRRCVFNNVINYHEYLNNDELWVELYHMVESEKRHVKIKGQITMYADKM